jgi:hypothetical protein
MKKLVLSAGLILSIAIWCLWQQSSSGEAPDPGGAPGPASAPLAGSPPPPPRPRLVEVATAPPLRVSRLSPPADPVPQAEPEGRPELTVAERRAQLQSRFAVQDIDPAWASAARQELAQDLVRFGGKDARVRDVECRSSLCRAELVLTSHDAGSSFMESWLRQRAWAGPGFAANDAADPDGTPKMILFLARPGAELPQLDRL